MKRPNKEDFHQQKTGENLMNGPYNYTRYSENQDKYIDYVEEQLEKEREKVSHSKATFQNILIQWGLTEKQISDIKSNIEQLTQNQE